MPTSTGFPTRPFSDLRDNDPVSWWDEHDGGKGFWAVTRYDDLLHVSRNVATFSSASGITLEEMDDDDFQARRNMLEYDPPEHTRFRRLVSKPFSRREVYAYENGIRTAGADGGRRGARHAAATSTSSRRSPSSCRCACSAVCWACPMTTVTGWSNAATRCSATSTRSSPTIRSGSVDTDEFKSIPFRSPAALDLYRYAEQQAEQRRRDSDRRRDHATSWLRRSTASDLTEREFKNFFVLLVSAGNDTTRYTMAAGMKALIERPDQLAELRDACSPAQRHRSNPLSRRSCGGAR